ncbi:MAG: outer membrane beta-barrel protein [Bacteroidia bacterium]|nr:outer membrane beta-barrel protein [Bacteroidia bacterium]
MNYIYKLVSIFCLTIVSITSYSQNFGFQFYQGVNKTLVSISGENVSPDYTSNFNSDTRLGVFYGDINKVSFSALVGASTTNAYATNDDISTSFTNSSLRIDLPVRYAFPKSFLNSIAVGPSIGLLMSSSQTVNGLPVRSEDLFSANNFYIVSEIDFTGYTSKKLNINPYVSYRLMLSNAEMDDDNLKINELSFGLRMDINK